MAKKAILVLEDGSVYEGYSFGAEADAEFVEKKRGLPIRVSLLASPDVAILAA